jgi:hypothetical protein
VPHPLLALQRSAGNRAVGTLVARTRPGHGRLAIARWSDADFEAGLREFADATGEMDFGGTGKEPRFDEAHWTCNLVLIAQDDSSVKRPYAGERGAAWRKLMRQNAEIDLEYVLKPGVRPSVAIRAIQQHPDRWALDCIDYVVATRLYAELRGSGDQEFDTKYTRLGSEISPAPMRMAQHDTPGLGTRDFWERDAQGEEFKSDKDDGEPTPTGVRPASPAEEDEFLKGVPIGARVMWTTTHPKAEEDMNNENTIKIAPNVYAAHPLGQRSGDEVREELIAGPDENKSERHAAHIAEYIYLSEVEWYARH